MSGAQAQAQALAGVFQPLAVGVGQAAMLLHAVKVEVRVAAALAFQLLLTCFNHLSGQLGAAWTGLSAGVEAGGFARHRQVQVDTVEKRPGEFVAVALDLLAAATAAPGRVAQVAAGAGVHPVVL